MKDYLKPFLRKEKALFLAYDHGFEHGPSDLFGKSIDPQYILDLAVKGGYTGIILQKGIAEKYYSGALYQRKIPLILKINGKTNLNNESDPYSATNCSIEYARELGAKAVGYTIYLGSEYEAKMFEEFGRIQEQAHHLGLAIVAWIYPHTKAMVSRHLDETNEVFDQREQRFGAGVHPRGKSIKNETSPDITAYAARVGLELGADMVKIKYSGSKESFQKAVEAAGRTKVVLSGGPFLSEQEFLEMIKHSLEAGAVGVAVGRNVWQRENALAITEKIKKILF